MALIIDVSYFLAAVLFIYGLKRMGSPMTARGGIVWAGAGMVLATVVTFLFPGMSNYILMMIAIGLGGIIAWISGKKVAMTDMPQMIALYNGMGGGAAAAIAAVELYGGNDHGLTFGILAVLGGFIGAVSFSGSLVAFAKLQGFKNTTLRFKGQQVLNLVILVSTLVMAVIVITQPDTGNTISIFFVLALALGITMTVPIGGADMPVVISLYNAFTGLAVAFEGFVQQNPAMIIAGTVVGAAGSLLTQLMAKAMNRSLANVLFSGFGETTSEETEINGSMKPIDASDVGVMMAFANKVLIRTTWGILIPLSKHLISGMPEPAAIGAIKMTIDAATEVSSTLMKVSTSHAIVISLLVFVVLVLDGVKYCCAVAYLYCNIVLVHHVIRTARSAVTVATSVVRPHRLHSVAVSEVSLRAFA
jgi:NAD(P) transhydrogenase subunit beta